LQLLPGSTKLHASILGNTNSSSPMSAVSTFTPGSSETSSLQLAAASKECLNRQGTKNSKTPEPYKNKHHKTHLAGQGPAACGCCLAVT
jgi:hypothetical protein